MSLQAQFDLAVQWETRQWETRQWETSGERGDGERGDGSASVFVR